MLITHRVALDPTNKQKTLFRQHAGFARFAWNRCLEESRRALDAGEAGATSQYRLRRFFNSVKGEIAPWSGSLSQNAAKYALVGLGEAWGRFWSELNKTRRVGTKCHVRPPRFKSRKRSVRAFRADNGPGTVKCRGKIVGLPRIGKVRMREACRFEGVVRECTVKHDGVRWHAIVVFDVAEPETKSEGACVGVDAGLRWLATVHDGESVEVIANPRPLKAALGKLRSVNRRIARSLRIHGRKSRSNRRERMYAQRRRLYVRLRSLRFEVAHKATTAIAKRSRLVCVESLNVSGWMRNRRLARSTADASPSRFLSLLKWKCRREGVRLVEAGRFYPSSKTCSSCGEVNAGLGMDHRWRCPSCGVVHDRDANASLNLRRQGLAADVEGVSDGRKAAVPVEASTRQISSHQCGLA